MSEPIEPVTPEIIPEDVSAEDPKTRGGKRLTKAQWLEIEDHYAYNTMSRKELEDTYDISGNSIRSHFKRLMEQGIFIGRGSKRHLLAGKTAAAVAGAVAASTVGAVAGGFASHRKERIEKSKTTLFQQTQIIEMHMNQLFKDIGDTTKPTITLDTSNDSFKALQRAVAINQNLIKARWTLLDIINDIDEATMPKLVFQDLAEEEIARMQSATGDEDEDEVDFPDDDHDVVEEGSE